MKSLFVNIIIPGVTDQVYTYSVPLDLSSYVEIGKRVEVQFGPRRRQMGIIIELSHKKPEFSTKDIINILDDNILISQKQLMFWRFIAEYYMCSLNEVFLAAIPKIFRGDSKSLIALKDDFDEISILKKISRIKGQKARNIWSLIVLLKAKKYCDTNEIKKLWAKKNINDDIRWLKKESIIEVKEEYKLKETREMVSVVSALFPNDESSFDKCLDSLGRASKQKELLSQLWLDGNRKWLKKDLKSNYSYSDSVLNSLIQKKLLLCVKEEYTPSISVTTELPKLSKAQKSVLNEIINEFTNHKHVLLKGVTSSGKSFIYFHLIQMMLQSKHQVLYLLPEIAITKQIIEKLRKYFGNSVYVYHSKLKAKEKANVWEVLSSGEACVVLGVRSSIFLPFNNLGLIVVDEEHDPSFKQQDPSPRYNARDLSLVLSKIFNANVVLGSATPSLESYFNSLRGKYKLIEINERYGNIDLPEIYLVGQNNMLKKGSSRPVFSKELILAIKDCLNNSKQVILFQNRRGYVPFLSCQDCEYIPTCRHCEITLTYHKKADRLVCHYCGYMQKAVFECEECGSENVKMRGHGTEKIEEELEVLFPDYSIGRLDLDTTRNKSGHENIISSLESGSTDILIGTQMVTKGLDFEDVDIVGILNAESLLYYPDFRANERAFAMMTQVAGRAGRRHKRGKVFIQTTDIENDVLQYLLKDDVDAFLVNELQIRKLFHYPPFYRLIRIDIKSADRNLAEQKCLQLAKALSKLNKFEILGPELAVISRVKGQYVVQILLKFDKAKYKMKDIKYQINNIVKSRKKEFEKGNIRCNIDVDPF